MEVLGGMRAIGPLEICGVAGRIRALTAVRAAPRIPRHPRIAGPPLHLAALLQCCFLLLGQGFQLRLNGLSPFNALLSLQLPQLLDTLLARLSLGFLRSLVCLIGLLVLGTHGHGEAQKGQKGGGQQKIFC